MPNFFPHNPVVSIVTVTYCSERHIRRLVGSVKKACLKNSFEHIIVDNNSTDNTVGILRSLGDSVNLIGNQENIGFSAANLIGYNHARGKYLLFLNPDMEIEEGGIDKILEWVDRRPKAGIVGCKLLDEEGNLNKEALPRRFPRIFEQFCLLLKLNKLFPHILDHYLCKDLDFNKDQEVDSVRGSFMLMPRSFIEAVGWPFDPRYYIWFEDVDICREAWKRGYEVIYTPAISCKDAVGQSFKQRDRKWRFQQYAKSLYTYFRKWNPIHIWIWIPLLFMPLANLIGSNWIGKLSQKLKA